MRATISWISRLDCLSRPPHPDLRFGRHGGNGHRAGWPTAGDHRCRQRRRPGRPSRRSKRRPRSCRPTSRKSPGRSCRSWTMGKTRPAPLHPRGPEPVERWAGRGDSRRRDFRPPRGRFRHRLQRQPAAASRQQRRPLPRHRVCGLRFPPQPGRAMVHAGRVRRDRAAHRRRSACPSSGWRRSPTS